MGEGGLKGQKLFAITRFLYFELLYHMSYFYWSKENHSLYQGLRYIEVHYVRVLRAVEGIVLFCLSDVFNLD